MAIWTQALSRHMIGLYAHTLSRHPILGYSAFVNAIVVHDTAP